MHHPWEKSFGYGLGELTIPLPAVKISSQVMPGMPASTAGVASSSTGDASSSAAGTQLSSASTWQKSSAPQTSPRGQSPSGEQRTLHRPKSGPEQPARTQYARTRRTIGRSG